MTSPASPIWPRGVHSRIPKDATENKKIQKSQKMDEPHEQLELDIPETERRTDGQAT